jgi:adenine-specific DNA-methyltransferase
MSSQPDSRVRKLLLDLVPPDGESVGNSKLREMFDSAVESRQYKVTRTDFDKVRDALIADGTLLRGKGRGGSVRRPLTSDRSKDADGGFSLQPQEIPADALKPKPKQGNLSLTQAIAQSGTKARAGQGKGTTEESKVLSYRHEDKRKNNPQVGLVNEANDPAQPKTVWRYDPHIDPALDFDVGRSQVEKLIDDALASGDEARMRAALEELKRAGSPYLNWAGKAERTSFDIDTVSLHVHERIDPMSILAAVSKNIKDAKAGKKGSFQPGLFEAPFENLPLREAVDFYKHERGWANRLIAGDSLLVMNSLLQKESMAGQVQMIYIDPPYGIKYGSNFQPFVANTKVKDRKDSDLTQEPETIKAFRDTWELGIHSYLTYLRDRLFTAKELIHESGSVFVQISEENVHHVREIMDEIFGVNQFVSLIPFRTKLMPLGARTLEQMSAFLVWYARDINKIKYRHLYRETTPDPKGRWTGTIDDQLNLRRLDKAQRMNLRTGNCPTHIFGTVSQWAPSYSEANDFRFPFHGENYDPTDGQCWVTSPEKMERLSRANRLFVEGDFPRFVVTHDDFPCAKITAPWDDTAPAQDKTYVVQTNEDVLARCILMCTDTGDLVFDPTCGSGTTAVVAERTGRRWITCDTSRVAIALAKQRLMTASFDYYELRYPQEGLRGGFIYKTIPRVSLKIIANNPEIDEIYQRMYPAIESALLALNTALRRSPPQEIFVIADGGRKGEKLNFAKTAALQQWEVPFDFPVNWPKPVRDPFDAFHTARQSMQKQMDMSIAAHAESEILYNDPEKSRTKLRIAGPFTVEAVPFATVLSLDDAEQPKEADVAIARSGESARQHSWRDELLKTGIRGKGGQLLKFSSLETLPGTACLHATGTLDSGERVVVSFGPEHAALEQRQVEHGLREASELFPLPKMIVFCAFAFDPEAAKDIDAVKGITALKAQMNTDLLTEDLKKARSSNQSFWLMGQPDVNLRKRKDGMFEVEVNGFDYFDTAKGELISGGKAKIAMWSLDTDYDDRSLFPRQVFFPMAGKGEGWAKLKRDIRAELDESLLDQFHGTVSLPFEAGENKKIAVKIVDDRGIESLKVIPLS